MSEEEELGRGKRKKRTALPYDYDSQHETDSSGEDHSYKPPKPPTPPKMMKKNDAYIPASSGMPKRPGQQKKHFKAAPMSPAAGHHLEAMHPRRRAPALVNPAEGHQQEDSAFGSTHPRSPASASASPAAGQQLETVNPRRHAPASVSPVPEYLMDSRPVETSSATSAVLTGPQMFAFMERVLSTLNKIKMVQQTQTQLLAELRNRSEDSGAEERSQLPDLPFQTVRDLMEWDEQMATNKEAKVQMKKHMMIQGGDSVRQKTTRILKSLMTWDLAKQFSWFGAKGKKKFNELNICQLLCACLTANANSQAEATLKNVEKAAMTWFRHAAERAAAGHRRVPTNEDEAGY